MIEITINTLPFRWLKKLINYIMNKINLFELITIISTIYANRS